MVIFSSHPPVIQRIYDDIARKRKTDRHSDDPEKRDVVYREENGTIVLNGKIL